MKKIINWLFGSFFRTIGRIIAFLFISFIILLIINKLGFNLKNLLFMSVSASEQNAGYSSSRLEVKQCLFDNTSCVWDKASLGGSINFGSSNGYINQYQFLFFNSSSNWAKDGIFKLQFTFDIISTSDWFDEIKNLYNFKFYSNTSSSSNGAISGSTNANLYSFDCSFSKTDNTSATITCTFVPKKDLKYIAVELYLNDLDISVSLTNKITYTKINYFTVDISSNSVINNQTEVIENNFNQTNQNINDLKNTIDSDNVSDAQSSASDFFNDFSTNTHGLTGIITAPLNAIQSLTSKSCSPLVLPLPYVNKSLTLPCMRSIYEEHFGSFISLYDIITLGIVSYWVMVRIFALVKDFKNPDHDEIEVMDL